MHGDRQEQNGRSLSRVEYPPSEAERDAEDYHDPPPPELVDHRPREQASEWNDDEEQAT